MKKRGKEAFERFARVAEEWAAMEHTASGPALRNKRDEFYLCYDWALPYVTKPGELWEVARQARERALRHA